MEKLSSVIIIMKKLCINIMKNLYPKITCIHVQDVYYDIPYCTSYNKFLYFIIIGFIILALITSHKL